MGGQAWAKQHVPELPKEVLQHIFSVTQPHDEDDEVLYLEDRVRALAVCRAWKACLDFKPCPISALYLEGDQGVDRRIAAWVARTQPAVKRLVLANFDSHQMLLTLLSITPRVALEDLSLHRGLRTLQDTLAAVCLFPRLKALSLRARDNWERRLDLAVLKPLLALERFSCSGWQSVGLKGTPVLPQLSFLEISSTRSTAIDAALLSLHELWISQTRTLQLRGLHLRLPQLSKLSLYKVNMGAVSWPALPQLKSLTAVECPELTVAAPAELPHLASLTLHWSRDCWEAGGRWLHAAPSSLQHMSFYGSTNDWSQPPPLSSVTQLTSLSCNSPAIIPYLHPLAQLQQLELSMNSVTDITLEHSGWLCGLSSLRQLCFGYRVNCLDSAIERLKQALAKLLPAGCSIEL